MITELPPGDPATPLTVRDALAYQLEQLLADEAAPTPDVARAYLAREHYFRTWERAMEAGDGVIDRRFEAAADAVANGDLATLERLLAEDPGLATARSSYGHGQTLLQHVSANGIEPTRQGHTPANACELARRLLAAGAEADARCNSYQPNDTALTLLVSSEHPAAAAVQADLVEVFVKGGANVDGPDLDSAPLWTAMVWGYNLSVDRLVKLGARRDSLVLAAGVGDLDRVKALIEQPRVDIPIVNHGKTIPAKHALECALIYAAGGDRLEVVEYLLVQKPDLTVSEPVWGATALGAASHPHPSAGRPRGNPRIIALLSP